MTKKGQAQDRTITAELDAFHYPPGYSEGSEGSGWRIFFGANHNFKDDIL